MWVRVCLSWVLVNCWWYYGQLTQHTANASSPDPFFSNSSTLFVRSRLSTWTKNTSDGGTQPRWLRSDWPAPPTTGSVAKLATASLPRAGSKQTRNSPRSGCCWTKLQQHRRSPGSNANDELRSALPYTLAMPAHKRRTTSVVNLAPQCRKMPTGKPAGHRHIAALRNLIGISVFVITRYNGTILRREIVSRSYIHAD